MTSDGTMFQGRLMYVSGAEHEQMECCQLRSALRTYVMARDDEHAELALLRRLQVSVANEGRISASDFNA